MRYVTPAGILAGALLLALPDAASSDAASGIPSLAAPLAACYSPKVDKFNNGSPGFRPNVGPLEFSGPPSDTRWEVRATTPDSGSNARNIRFGADGRASLPEVGGLSVLVREVGPGDTLSLDIRDSNSPDPATTPLGTTRVAALGVRIVPSTKASSQPYRSTLPVVVSGVQFANKTLYGFIVEYKAPRKSTNQDPARFSRKVVHRVALGKGDACGFLKKKVALNAKVRSALNAKVRSGFSHQLYVNAGPKLDKPNAVRTTQF